MDSEQTIAVIDAAEQLRTRKQTLFKVLRRLGIQPEKRRDPERGNQSVAYITLREFQLLKEELWARSSPADGDTNAPRNAGGSPELGVFYLVQLEPDLDPRRLKLGFAVNLDERLRTLRCSAPFAKVIKAWPSRRLWEKTAIESVTVDCEQLHTEVFRPDSMDAVVARCEDFFALMPKLAHDTSDGVSDTDQMDSPS